jgi:hypothetical protein
MWTLSTLLEDSHSKYEDKRNEMKQNEEKQMKG